MHILILEDDPIDLELIKSTLHNGGVEGSITSVSNRQAFLDQLNTLIPDVILADYVLPAFGGDVALALKKRSLSRCAFYFGVRGVGGRTGDRSAEARGY